MDNIYKLLEYTFVIIILLMAIAVFNIYINNLNQLFDFVKLKLYNTHNFYIV